MNISIIIPVYNGEKTIEELSRQIISCLDSHVDLFEIIFVSDCGPDNSWKVIENLVRHNNSIIKGIRLTRNYGQHNAILAGIEHAKGNFILTMDEDLQHSPQDILLLINKQKENDADVIYGKYSELKHSSFRNITSVMMKKLLHISLPDLIPQYSAFRLMKAEIAHEITKMNNSYTFLDGYISWITNDVDFVLVSHNERQEGESSYTTKKLIEHSINIFVTFSNFPIRFLSYFSILVFLSTFVYSLYVILRVIISDDLAMGFPTLIILLGFGVGSIMLGIGILGEYLYRVNLKTTKRPNFVVKKTI